MTFDYSDAWLLQAIKFSESEEQGATLTHVIKAADYIDHAILTYLEFSVGTKKLKSIGLIIEKDKRLQTTKQFKEWWTKKYEGKSRIVMLKVMAEIKNYLDKNFMTINEQMTEINTEFTESDFNNSVSEYQNLASEIIEKLTRTKKAKG